MVIPLGVFARWCRLFCLGLKPRGYQPVCRAHEPRKQTYLSLTPGQSTRLSHLCQFWDWVMVIHPGNFARWCRLPRLGLEPRVCQPVRRRNRDMQGSTPIPRGEPPVFTLPCQFWDWVLVSLPLACLLDGVVFSLGLKPRGAPTSLQATRAHKGAPDPIS